MRRYPPNPFLEKGMVYEEVNVVGLSALMRGTRNTMALNLLP